MNVNTIKFHQHALEKAHAERIACIKDGDRIGAEMAMSSIKVRKDMLAAKGVFIILDHI